MENRVDELLGGWQGLASLSKIIRGGRERRHRLPWIFYETILGASTKQGGLLPQVIKLHMIGPG